MSGLTKLGFSLTFLLSLSLLGLVAELIYLLHRHRRRHHDHSPADPEIAPPSDGPSPTGLLLYLCCFKHRSRVEPAAPVPADPKPQVPELPADEEGEECEIAQWRAMCMGPSRALYTIKEENEEEEEAEETPFVTPCTSLRFDTPSPSPPRQEAETGGTTEVRGSKSDREAAYGCQITEN